MKGEIIVMYTRKAIGFAVVVLAVSIGLFAGYTRATTTMTLDRVETAQFVQFAPGESVTVEIPEDLWEGPKLDCRVDGGSWVPARLGGCSWLPGRVFTAVYEGPNPIRRGWHDVHWGSWAGMVPSEWIS